MNRLFFTPLLCLAFAPLLQAQKNFTLSNPDKSISVNVWLTQTGEPRYAVSYHGATVLKESKLGLRCEDGDFSQGLKFLGASPQETVKDDYELFTGKKRLVHYVANKRVIHLKNGEAEPFDIVFQLSNDGVAFRYAFPIGLKEGGLINEERTSYHFDTSARGFLQPMQVAKSGWEKSNPAYEEHYQQNVPVTTPSTLGAGWVYPALFHYKNVWLLITEAAVDSNHCATRLQNATADGELGVGFPDAREVFTGGGLRPKASGRKGQPELFPWRLISIGSLKTIAESTLGTDLAKPTVAFDKSFIKPGKASWSWIMSKDDSIVYSEQIRYIDFASKMNWQYCLVDAAWDKKIGYEKTKELARYAGSKNVGLLLWYNSAGDWNTVKYTPKNKLLTHDGREKEFALLKEMGVKGVKIDFFGGDGQSMMAYYLSILTDAAKAGLLVNFHGATLPRGWARTYPNLLTTEAVRGFEMITFNQADADAEANHCAMLPFARNAFDPMDFTPMNLYSIPTKVKRKTTAAFELATSVLFLSGIQHFAESPAGMSHVPAYVQTFLKDLPVRWDDVKFMDGFPGRYVVLARKAGGSWYVAGINAESTERTVAINLSQFGARSAQLITDDGEGSAFSTQEISSASSPQTIKLKPSGGFVMRLK